MLYCMRDWAARSMRNEVVELGTPPCGRPAVPMYGSQRSLDANLEAQSGWTLPPPDLMHTLHQHRCL